MHCQDVAKSGRICRCVKSTIPGVTGKALVKKRLYVFIDFGGVESEKECLDENKPTCLIVFILCLHSYFSY